MDREFLLPLDIKDLTQGQTKPEAQAQALRQMGIPYKMQGKRVLVSRYHVRLWLSGATVTPTTRPNLAAIA